MSDIESDIEIDTDIEQVASPARYKLWYVKGGRQKVDD